jgi:hypothetical protein
MRTLRLPGEKGIGRSHRGGAEDAEERVIDQEILRSLRTPPLCGELEIRYLTAVALRTRPSTKLRMRGMKNSAHGEPVEPCASMVKFFQEIPDGPR